MDEINVKRDKRAKSMAAMGLVKRDGATFQVSTPSLRGKQTSYKVWREESGKIKCNCLEFEEEITKDAGFRCEHILAVKYALVAKNTGVVAPEAERQEKPSETAKTAPLLPRSEFTQKPNTLVLTVTQTREEGVHTFNFDFNYSFLQQFADKDKLKGYLMKLFQAYLQAEDQVWKDFEIDRESQRKLREQLEFAERHTE